MTLITNACVLWTTTYFADALDALRGESFPVTDELAAHLTPAQHDHINFSRYTYLSPLAQFFRETAQWGWSNVPGRPLLGPSDFPKLPARLPRFIPRDELDRLMEVIEALDDPFRRTALLLLR